MDHFAPHPGITFEGYYSKFRLPSGSSIAFIVSAIPAIAKEVKFGNSSSSIGDEIIRRKAFMVSFTYVSPDSSRHWQRDYWPKGFEIDLLRSGSPPTSDRESKYGFDIKWDSGEFGWRSNSADGSRKDLVWWKLKTDEVIFEAETLPGDDGHLHEQSRTPWQSGQEHSTPAGILARAPLPIQWHVHSLDSPCRFQLDTRPDPAVSFSETPLEVHPNDRDTNMLANVHTEKNWALTFPESYIWIQAREHDRGEGVCVAGGTLFKGVHAYLVGYQGQRSVYFRPPTSTCIFSLSLGMQPDISYPNRQIKLDIKGWFRRLIIHAKAPVPTDTPNSDTFFTLAAPLRTGHAPNYCTQSFAASVGVKVFERKWLGTGWTLWNGGFGEWQEVEERTWQRGSLEFGGDFYRKHVD